MRTILIILIVLICGSLKPAIQPCSKTIWMDFYKNGKLVLHTKSNERGFHTSGIDLKYDMGKG